MFLHTLSACVHRKFLSPSGHFHSFDFGANRGIHVQIIIIVYAVPLRKRPAYQGLFGAVYGVSSVIGPLVGGAFTTNVTWRWCFYINLPLGGVVMFFVFFLLHVPSRPGVETSKFMQKLKQLNAEGIAALLPAVVCLCLALQWGGFAYPVSGIHASRVTCYRSSMKTKLTRG